MKSKIIRLIICFAILISVVFSLPISASASDSEPLSVDNPAHAAAIILGNVETGEILWAQNEDEPLPPASTTKVMTALLTIEAIESGRISESSTVTITEEMINSLPSDASTMSIPAEDGETFTVLDLLYATMVVSDCRASNALAFCVSGSVESFAELMNERAKELGCSDTIFTNPSGYPDDIMKTTARSLYIIFSEALKHDLFKTVSSAVEYTIPATNMNDSRTIKSHNYLLTQADSEKEESAYYYPYAIGSKTGYSTPSGPCLVSAAEKDGVSLVAVVLNGEIVKDESGKMIYNRYIDTVRMFEYGFAVLNAREIRAAMASEKSAIVEKSRSAANERLESVLAGNAQIKADFEKLQKEELTRQQEITKYTAVASACVVILIIAVLITLKIRRKFKRK